MQCGALFHFVIGILLFQGNLLVLVAVSRYMRPWTATNILIASMSASDLMSSFICNPIQVGVVRSDITKYTDLPTTLFVAI